MPLVEGASSEEWAYNMVAEGAESTHELLLLGVRVC